MSLPWIQAELDGCDFVNSDNFSGYAGTPSIILREVIVNGSDWDPSVFTRCFGLRDNYFTAEVAEAGAEALLVSRWLVKDLDHSHRPRYGRWVSTRRLYAWYLRVSHY